MTEPIGFGDNVRVVRTDETVEMGVAELVGQVYGHTTPSITGVEFVGETETDLAYAVNFDHLPEPIWFAPPLLEFVNHAPGTDVQVGGRRFVRAESGEWVDQAAETKRRWWRRRP